jgi:hypothetical protein
MDDAEPEPMLSRRTQVNLKDKARQMAVDYYKFVYPSIFFFSSFFV